MPTTATQLSDAQRQMFRKDGYLILRNTFSSDRVQSLVDAVDRWLNRALAGEFTKPTEWIDREHRIPRVVYNMLHPENMILLLASGLMPRSSQPSKRFSKHRFAVAG